MSKCGTPHPPQQRKRTHPVGLGEHAGKDAHESVSMLVQACNVCAAGHSRTPRPPLHAAAAAAASYRLL